MNKYIKGLGVYVGKFSEEDINAGRDRLAVQAAMDETGLKYTNTKLVWSSVNGKVIALEVYVCNVNDFRV